MRFQVGQIVVGYRFIIEMADGRVMKTCSNLFRHGSRSIKFDLIILECIEHHRVPTDYVDGYKSDGFVFKDVDGNIFNNQYPQASYGQISDDNDRIFSRFTEKCERVYYLLFNTYAESLLSNLYDEYRKPERNIPFIKILRDEFTSFIDAYVKITGDRPKFRSMKPCCSEPTDVDSFNNLGVNFFHGLYEMI